MESILLEGGKPDLIMRSRQSLNHASGRISDRRQRSLQTGEIAAMGDEVNLNREIPSVHAREHPEEWLRIPVTDDVEINVKAGSLPGGQKEKKEFIEKLSARLRMFIENEKTAGGK